jgi:hypothetical protein
VWGMVVGPEANGGGERRPKSSQLLGGFRARETRAVSTDVGVSFRGAP